MAAVSPKRSDIPTSLKSLIYYEFQLQGRRSFCATNISLNNANKILQRTKKSPENEEFGHFTLLFCRGRKRNVQRIITHVHRRCFVH